MRLLKRIDILFFSYLLITSILLLFSYNESADYLRLFLIRLIIFTAIILLIYFNYKVKSKVIYLLRNVYPIILSGYFYSETVFYNKLFFNNLDDYFIKLDALIFGFQPSIFFSEYFSSKIFSELMYFGYFSFFPLIIAFTLFFYFKKKKHFIEMVFKLSVSMFLFYFIFGFIPSSGPQFYFQHPNNTLPSAFYFDKIMQFIQEKAEQPTGAFPSSHVGISFIVLLLAKKRDAFFFYTAIPFVFILILSTVYIKAHYFVDIIGGLLIAPIILYLASFLYKTSKENLA